MRPACPATRPSSGIHRRCRPRPRPAPVPMPRRCDWRPCRRRSTAVGAPEPWSPEVPAAPAGDACDAPRRSAPRVSREASRAADRGPPTSRRPAARPRRPPSSAPSSAWPSSSPWVPGSCCSDPAATPRSPAHRRRPSSSCPRRPRRPTTAEPTAEPTDASTPAPTPFKAPTFTGKSLEEAQALADSGGLELDIQLRRDQQPARRHGAVPGAAARQLGAARGSGLPGRRQAGAHRPGARPPGCRGSRCRQPAARLRPPARYADRGVRCRTSPPAWS